MIPLPIIGPPLESPLLTRTPAEIERKERIAAKARARAETRRREIRAHGELRFYRFRIIKARMMAHGIPLTCYLGPSMLANRPLEEWVNKPNERAILLHVAGPYNTPFIDACRANPSLEGKDFHENPVVVLRFEHASVIGSLGDCISASANKSWGQALSLDPVSPTMDISGMRILYQYHATSKYNRRVEQRKTMKRLLGANRSAVGEAMSSTKKQWMDWIHERPALIDAIRDKLRVDPGEFWRAVKGNVFLDERPALERGELF